LTNKIYPTTTPDWQAAVRRRTNFYVLAAVLLAVLFGILVFEFFSRLQGTPPAKLTAAVFASSEIQSGTVLSAEMLEVQEISAGAVPASHLTSVDQALGLKTLYPLVKGELILAEKLAGTQGGAAAQRCPAGKWCVNIPAAWFIAEPPELAPGDQLEIASVLPGSSLAEAGFIAAGVTVVDLLDADEAPAYLLALEDQEALSLLYARANQFQLMVLLRPMGK
jgi:hypothetical protein